MSVLIRDGSGTLQTVFSSASPNCRLAEAKVVFNPETSVTLSGTLKKLPQGKIAPGGVELLVDTWELIHTSPEGGYIRELNRGPAWVETLFSKRHLMIRGERAVRLLKVRAGITRAIREHYHEKGYLELTPPTIVQTMVGDLRFDGWL